MALQIYEGFPSREAISGGDNPSVALNWIVLGTDNDSIVKSLVRATTPTGYLDPQFAGAKLLFLRDIAVKEVAPSTWECQARYGARKPPKENEYKFEFDTTGGRQKITQSLETIHKYAPAGKTAPDHKGAIGVTDHGVEGCEIVVPKFSWSETWQLPIETHNWAYSQTLKAITGRVNASPFRGFPAGQVLFRGGIGSGSNKDPNLIEITFHFDQSDDVEGQTIGDIAGVAKAGWQYLWVQYRETDDSTANDFARRPVAAYVERVYDATSFGPLGIGD
jgi:hypothetical protein